MKFQRRAIPAAVLVLALALVAAGGLGGHTAANAQGDGAKNDGAKWSPVTVLYLSDTRGKIEPCG
jgi:hypothetical protein